MRATSNRVFGFLCAISLGLMCFSMGKGRWLAAGICLVAAIGCYLVLVLTPEDE